MMEYKRSGFRECPRFRSQMMLTCRRPASRVRNEPRTPNNTGQVADRILLGCYILARLLPTAWRRTGAVVSFAAAIVATAVIADLTLRATGHDVAHAFTRLRRFPNLGRPWPTRNPTLAGLRRLPLKRFPLSVF
jgi:hypothetical protein